MIVKVTIKHCRLSSGNIEIINHYFDKIDQMLPHYDSDLPLLAIIIRRDKNFYPPSKIADSKNLKRKIGLVDFYEGSLTLHLPPRPIEVHFQGKTIDECLNVGFDILLEKIKRFKDKKFPSESEYPNHSTIRGGV